MATIAKECRHLESVRPVTPRTEGCEGCLKTGDSWVHLRLCLACGYVGCCDQSKNKHATRHFEETGDPIIRSLEPGEEWGWCYRDQGFLPARMLAGALRHVEATFP